MALFAGMASAATTINFVGPANNSYFNATGFNVTFNYTSSDVSMMSDCVLKYLPSGTVSTGPLNNNINYVDNYTFDTGVVTWYVNCTNGTNNFTTSGSYKFTIEAVAPSVVINSPANAAKFASKAITINVTATDNYAINYTNVSIYNAGNGALVNSTVNSTNGTFVVTLNVPSDGVFNISATAYDNATNRNTSIATGITVDTTGPSFTVSQPTEAQVLYSYVVNVTAVINGTGSNVKNVTVLIVDSNLTIVGNYYNNSSANTANCTQTGATIATCVFQHSFGATAYDNYSLRFTALDVLNNSNTYIRNFSYANYSSPPTCVIDRIVSLSSTGYANGSTFYYKPAGGAFQVFVNSSSSGSTIANVTFPNVSTFNASGSLVASSAQYNITYTWSTGANATGAMNVTCYDNAGNSNTTQFAMLPVNSGPNVSMSYGDADTFYSPAAGNDIIHVRVNASATIPIANVTADFIAVNPACGVVNLSYNAISGFYEGNCSVGSVAATCNFTTGFRLNMTARDMVGNLNSALDYSVVLYNMTTPTADPTGCSAFDTDTTDMSTVPNFAAVNLVLGIKLNSSCAPGALWNGTKRVAMLNFSSLDISTATKAQQLSGIASALNITIAPPHTFTPSRIYVNVAAFTQLNTTTIIHLYDMPFGSQPNVTQDSGAAPVSITWSQGGYNTTYRSMLGNLTINVSHFSGYNVTDNVAPTVAFALPVAGYNSSSAAVTINVSANGTGTEISKLIINVTLGGTTYGYYLFNNTTGLGNNSAGCINLSAGWENVTCQVIFTAPANGTYSLYVAAYDYGNITPGNLNSTTRNFTVDTVGPVISLSASNVTATSAQLIANASDAFSGVKNCTYSGSGAVASGNLTLSSGLYTASLSGLAANTTYAVNVTCDDNVGNSVLNSTSFTTASGAAILPVDLRTAGNFVILAKTGITGGAGSSIVGDIGVSPIAASAITGFGLIMDSSGTFSTSSVVNGSVYAADYAAPTPSTMTTAVSDMETAYGSAAGRAPTYPTELYSGDISGQTLAPGVYKWSTDVLINTDVTLSGSATDVWIFEMAGDLTIASAKHVILGGGAQAKNVFWQVGGTVGATLGSGSTFNGNILSAKQVIMNSGAVLNGKALAQTQVTLIANNVTDPTSLPADPGATGLIINSPAAGAHLGNRTLNISLTVNGSINTTTITITNSTGSTVNSTSNNTTGTYNVLLLVPADGIFTITAVTRDLNNSTITKLRLAAVDTTAPLVTLASPGNGTQSTNSTPIFTFNYVDSLSSTASCTLFVNGAAFGTNGSVANTTNTAIIANASLISGSNIWYVNCTDLSGNLGNSSTRALLVNYSISSINNINGVGTGYGTSNATMTINFTADASNITNWTLSVYNSTWGLLQNWTGNTSNISAVETYANATNGTYYANLTVINPGAVHITSFTVYVDQSAPVFNSLSTSGVTSSGATLTVNASDTYSGINNCTYSGAGSGSLALSGGLYTAALSGLSSSMAYTVNVTCYDKAGHLASNTTSFTTANSDSGTTGGNSGSSSNGGGSMGSGGSSSAASTKQSATVNVDVGLGKTCAVTITREMASTTALSTLTTTLENIGGAGCSMSDFVFTDTIPADFPALNDVAFNPQYASRAGWAVTFNFPTFAAGESKTLSYSANQWIKTSLAKNFTAYTMAAKKQQAAQPAVNTTAPAVPEAPPVRRPNKLPSPPSAQPAAQAAPTPVPQPQSGSASALLLTAFVVIVVLAGIVGVAIYMKGRKKGK